MERSSKQFNPDETEFILIYISLFSFRGRGFVPIIQNSLVWKVIGEKLNAIFG